MIMEKYSVKREVKDVFYLLVLQGLNYIAPLLVLPYLMKVLGAEKFGYIGFSLSVTQYLMLIVDFGFNLSATKRIALAKGNQVELNNIFTSTLYAKIGLLILSFFVLLILAQVPKFEVYRETMFVMFVMVIANTFSFVWLFQGMGKIRVVSIINMISKLSVLPLTFVFVKSSSDYLMAAFIQSFVFVVGALLTTIFIKYKKIASVMKYSKTKVLIELKEGYPIFLSSAASSIYTASFVIVLGFFATPAEVGQYSAVDRIMRAICYLALIPVLQAFYPKISRLTIENINQAKQLVRKIMFFILGSMFLVFIVLFFLSPFAIQFLGKDYQQTGWLFKIMSFVPIFVGTGGVIAQLGILAIGDTSDKKNFQRVYFIAGAVAIVSVLILVPFFFAQGAAISLLLTEIVVCLLMFWYGRKVIF